MSTDGSDMDSTLHKGNFDSIIIPGVNHPTPFPKKASNANALKLFINEEPIGVRSKRHSNLLDFLFLSSDAHLSITLFLQLSI